MNKNPFEKHKQYHNDQPVIFVDLDVIYNWDEKEYISTVKLKAFNAGSDYKTITYNFKRDFEKYSTCKSNQNSVEFKTILNVLKHITKFGKRRNIEFFTNVDYIHDIIMDNRISFYISKNWIRKVETDKNNNIKEIFYNYKEELLDIYNFLQNTEHVVKHVIKDIHPEMFSFFKDKLLNV